MRAAHVDPRPLVDYRVGARGWVLAVGVACWHVAPAGHLTLPAGFRCDLASIPRALWRVVAPFELGLAPPIVHDWLYRHGGAPPDCARRYTRAEADRLFLALMIDEGVPRWRRQLAYRAVRWFGGGAWSTGARVQSILTES